MFSEKLGKYQLKKAHIKAPRVDGIAATESGFSIGTLEVQYVNNRMYIIMPRGYPAIHTSLAMRGGKDRRTTVTPKIAIIDSPSKTFELHPELYGTADKGGPISEIVLQVCFTPPYVYPPLMMVRSHNGVIHTIPIINLDRLTLRYGGYTSKGDPISSYSKSLGMTLETAFVPGIMNSNHTNGWIDLGAVACTKSFTSAMTPIASIIHATGIPQLKNGDMPSSSVLGLFTIPSDTVCGGCYLDVLTEEKDILSHYTSTLGKGPIRRMEVRFMSYLYDEIYALTGLEHTCTSSPFAPTLEYGSDEDPTIIKCSICGIYDAAATPDTCAECIMSALEE